MNILANFRSVVAGLVCLSMIGLGVAGCDSDPATTVQIEITGKLEKAKRDRIFEELKSLAEGSGHSISASSSSEGMSVSLSPVSDVDAFSKRINFGTVTKVVGRTLHVVVSD